MQLISVQIEPVITLIIMMYWWLYMHWKQIQTALKAFLNRRITWWISNATQIEFFEIQHIRCDIDSHLSLAGLSMVNGVYPVDFIIAIIVIQRKWVLTESDVCKKWNQHNVENGIHTHILWGYSLIWDGTNTLSLWYYYGSYFGEYSEIWIERPYTIWNYRQNWLSSSSLKLPILSLILILEPVPFYRFPTILMSSIREIVILGELNNSLWHLENRAFRCFHSHYCYRRLFFLQCAKEIE